MIYKNHSAIKHVKTRFSLWAPNWQFWIYVIPCPECSVSYIGFQTWQCVRTTHGSYKKYKPQGLTQCTGFEAVFNKLPYLLCTAR